MKLKEAQSKAREKSIKHKSSIGFAVVYNKLQDRHYACEIAKENHPNLVQDYFYFNLGIGQGNVVVEAYVDGKSKPAWNIPAHGSKDIYFGTKPSHEEIFGRD